MGTQLDEARRALLLKTVPLTLIFGTFQVARTPAGPGLAAYMSLINRRRVAMWDELKSVDIEAPEADQKKADEENQKVIDNYLRENHVQDTKDLCEALYWSIARVDPAIERAALELSIDGSNQEAVFSLLVDLNTIEGTKIPKATTPTETAGTVTTTEISTPATGETI